MEDLRHQDGLFLFRLHVSQNGDHFSNQKELRHTIEQVRIQRYTKNKTMKASPGRPCRGKTLKTQKKGVLLTVEVLTLR